MKFPANIGNTTEKAVFQTADLLWQDVAGMVEQLIAAPEENCVYAVLKSGVSGNAVVAVKTPTEPSCGATTFGWPISIPMRTS